VVDKFAIPTVKVTGGQRIDMLGVKKEDLPAVWVELGKAGFISGHASAKGLRTVKTCVGSDWCRFGTQDSTGLGVKIEKFMWGSWTPAKVKMAVSGYEIHFAGAAGLDIKGTEVLGLVRTEAEAIEHIAALVQMYREQGHYLERIYKWAKRVGVKTIRKQIMNDAGKRQALCDRFVFSQVFAQVDPWDVRASGKDRHEFRPMAELQLEAA
jgi:nitrite reductase (NADH) large subunit